MDLSLSILALPLAALFLLGVVAARITQFFVFDSLMGANPESGSKFSVAVDKFAYWQLEDADAEGARVPGQDRSFVRGKLGDLVTCPYCLGFWISAVLYLAFTTYAHAWSGSPLWVHAAGVFAVAGFQMTINKLAR